MLGCAEQLRPPAKGCWFTTQETALCRGRRVLWKFPPLPPKHLSMTHWGQLSLLFPLEALFLHGMSLEGRWATSLPPADSWWIWGQLLQWVFPMIPVLRLDPPSPHFCQKEVRSLDSGEPHSSKARAVKAVETHGPFWPLTLE